MSSPERQGEGPGSSQYDPLTKQIVATCFWEGCDEPGTIVRELGLQPTGSKVIRQCKVPVCPKHDRQWRLTGHFRLFTHPDNLLGQ